MPEKNKNASTSTKIVPESIENPQWRYGFTPISFYYQFNPEGYPGECSLTRGDKVSKTEVFPTQRRGEPRE
jgi:hypothetical protein